MAVATLLVAGGVSVAVGLSFAAVARAVGRRVATGPRKTALRAYCAWWASLAAYLIVQGGMTVAAAYDALDASVYFVSRILMVPVLCLAVWGITSYLLYLYTGRARVFVVLGVFYAIVAVAFYWVTFSGDRAIQVERWLISVDDATLPYRLIYLTIGVPPVLSAFAYLGLWRRVKERAQRYRIVLVSGSIIAYVGGGLVARLLANDVAIFVTLVLLGALTAGAGLAAFYPPPGVRRWLAVTPPERERALAERTARRERRMVELV